MMAMTDHDENIRTMLDAMAKHDHVDLEPLIDQPDVFLYDWRDNDSRTLRVVVTADNDVSFEERTGRDSLGVDIWTPLTFDEKNINGFPLMTRSDWAEVAVLAVLRGKRG